MANKLSIIIPAYNEGDHIYEVVHQVLQAEKEICDRTGLLGLEVVAVNDGSTDRTAAELSRLKSDSSSLIVVTHPVNKGYGAALKTGFESSTGEYVSFMDGDGTIDARAFVGLFLGLQQGNADMAVGKRFGEAGSQMPFVRKMGNHFFAMLLSILSGTKVQDTASGIRVFKRGLIPLMTTLPDGLHFTPAMSAKAVHEKVKIVEVPISYSERSGESKLRVVRDGIRFLKIIVSTVLMYNPFKVFLMVGGLFELVAAILLAYPIYLKLTTGALSYTDYIYRSIGALYFFVAGAQLILFGILARFIVSTFFRRHETSVWIHQLNDRLKVYDRMSWYGAAVSAAGVLVNAGYFFEYLKGKLQLHWSWLLLAAGLIIIGIQMIITGVVMRILKDIHIELSSKNPR